MTEQTILFVDDEAAVLTALKRALRKEPYRILCAAGPEAAMRILEAEPVDVVVSDNMMPEMDGIAFLNMVKQLFPQVVRIILTGHADLQVAMGAINQGEVYRFLSKPWNDLELKVTLKQIFDFLSLQRQNQHLTEKVEQQQDFIEKLKQEHPGLLEVERDESGAIVIDDSSL